MQTPTQLMHKAEQSLDRINVEIVKLKNQYSRSTLAEIQHELRVAHEVFLELDRLLRDVKL